MIHREDNGIPRAPDETGRPPWQWHLDDMGREVNLYDADEFIVMCPADSGRTTLVASAHVGELLRAAPEMERMLRRLGEFGPREPGTGNSPMGTHMNACAWCSGSTGHYEHCELAALLARLDAARKAGG